MRITIVQGAFFPISTGPRGSVEKIWYSLGKEFARLGHQVIHISRSYPGLTTEDTADGVRYIRVGGFSSPRSAIILKLLDLIYSFKVMKILPESDILVTNTFWLPIMASEPKYGKLYIHIARYPKGQLWFYRNAARLQTVSSAIARAIILQEPRNKQKVSVIPYFIEQKIKSEELNSFFGSRKKFILYVGRVHPEKGIDLLLGAFERLVGSGFKEWRLVIVGPSETALGGGGEAYVSGLKKKSKKISENIIWAGPAFSEKELAEYYLKASLFVYPSLAEKGETFGLAPLEAMGYGCPVLVSDLECFKDFIEYDRTGAVFDHRAKDPIAALSERIKLLIESEGLLCELGKNGYNRAHENSMEHVAAMYIADFESLIRV